MTKTKMTFTLAKDEDGYPPDDFETLWVEDLGSNRYRIDNIPFYIVDISPDDIVEGIFVDGILRFNRLLGKSDISVIRIIFFEKEGHSAVLNNLVSQGCKWEGGNLRMLYSVEIPHEVSLDSIRKFLRNESSRGVLDYEEASLRQQR